VNTVTGVPDQTTSGATRPMRTLADALSRRALPVALMSALAVVPNVSTVVRQHEHDFIVIFEGDSATLTAPRPKRHEISELGWTTEQAATVFASLAVFADDWDGPGMDAYDDL
jgi:hypothetical protein